MRDSDNIVPKKTADKNKNYDAVVSKANDFLSGNKKGKDVLQKKKDAINSKYQDIFNSITNKNLAADKKNKKE